MAASLGRSRETFFPDCHENGPRSETEAMENQGTAPPSPRGITDGTCQSWVLRLRLSLRGWLLQTLPSVLPVAGYDTR